ncbi:cytochrome P450 [Marasmius fiardii PR-910]|nr:cytochrome P450 [Marasmius fiardii PR-910]
MTFFITILIPLILASTIIFSWLRSTRRLSLPPGPKGSFFTGVKDQLPPSPWKKYAEWAESFCTNILYFRVYNRDFIVLNDHTAVHDLLNSRAGIYSDRPKAWMFFELCARENAVFNISATSPRHSQYRRLLQTRLSGQAIKEMYQVLTDESERMVHAIASSPSDYEKHIRRNSVGVIMKVAYGYEVVSENDHFIDVAEECAKISGWAMAPGRWLVDYYPILRFIPSWLPFAGFQRQAEQWKKRLSSLSDEPHQWVKNQMKSDSHMESFTSKLMNPEGRGSVSAAEEDLIKWTAGGLYVGATDTTISAMISFMLLMALHPEAQKKAQAEIDQIVGSQPRLPEVDELPHLHYLYAIMKEVLRYAPVANIALPHRVIREDEYKGYRIPKDATVIANVWSIMHDPNIYPNPMKFDPDRFFGGPTNSNEKHSRRIDSETTNPDPTLFAFGFGRRSCPGIRFAETSLLLCMARILAKFTIRLPSPVPDPSKFVEFTSGITSHIKPFEIQIRSRVI